MNRNDQQAYDRGTSLYSPDGRIYQVEYAREAVKRGAPSVGVRTSDGVVLAAQSRAGSSLMVQESIEKLHKLDEHVGAASAGHVADARKLVDFARRESQSNRLRYGEAIGIETLTKEITDLIQENTQRGGTRPYGAALLVGGIDATGPRLFGTDPSGTPHEWKAVAIGGGRETIQDFLEEEYSEELTLEDGVSVAVGALMSELEEAEAESLSVATISEEEGFQALTTEEIAAHLDDVDTDEPSDDE
ncbi:proteasome alpha subunit [Halogranum gelatinilyticum]|jgi:proteasome alpha subunit|uniref:Proteasome subunit alpha n=1 Tax=Halogranum gelatinilyticum TaxID=660521 RepID=A0A1G9SJM9_9EURY|nr:archaeal proteasome endopeptidase complex subunit alpha [Halogranum gelatinilyticum]SDM35500.1 proteasome alpha subunit [Halogranum gelatinilyticum]